MLLLLHAFLQGSAILQEWTLLCSDMCGTQNVAKLRKLTYFSWMPVHDLCFF